jgi:hypothetical protein
MPPDLPRDFSFICGQSPALGRDRQRSEQFEPKSRSSTSCRSRRQRKRSGDRFPDEAKGPRSLPISSQARREARGCRASESPSWAVGAAGVRDCGRGTQDGVFPVAACAGQGAALSVAGSGPMRGTGSTIGGSLCCSGAWGSFLGSTASIGSKAKKALSSVNAKRAAR